MHAFWVGQIYSIYCFSHTEFDYCCIFDFDSSIWSGRSSLLQLFHLLLQYLHTIPRFVVRMMEYIDLTVVYAVTWQPYDSLWRKPLFHIWAKNFIDEKLIICILQGRPIQTTILLFTQFAPCDFHWGNQEEGIFSVHTFMTVWQQEDLAHLKNFSIYIFLILNNAIDFFRVRTSPDIAQGQKYFY